MDGARYCTTAWWQEPPFSPRQFRPTLLPFRSLRPTSPTGTVEVIFRADPNIYDGRYANVGWLQEIPKPVTSMSWDNAALMSYPTLAKFGLAEQDVVAIESNGNTVHGSGAGGSRPPRWFGHGVPGLCAPQWGPRGRWVGL